LQTFDLFPDGCASGKKEECRKQCRCAEEILERFHDRYSLEVR
jgi:hypothetical protein